MGEAAGRAPALSAEVVSSLRAALAVIPVVAALSPPAMARLLEGVEGACRGYLADRAVAPGTRSGEVAERLERAATAARTLTLAVEALDGVGWGLVGRRLRQASEGGGEATPPGDTQTLLACARRIASALKEAAAIAQREPQVGLDRARLRLAANAATALVDAKLPLDSTPTGALASCVRAAFAAVRLEAPPDSGALLERAARVAHRERGTTARA
jgi:hypothetical protein